MKNVKQIKHEKIISDFIGYNYQNKKKILEVGGGKGKLALNLKKKGYDVTIIDPYTPKYINLLGIKVYNHLFTENLKTEKYDLIIGIHSCSATELIIKNSIKNNKEFVVVPCEPKKINGKLVNRSTWINYLKNLNDKIKKFN